MRKLYLLSSWSGRGKQKAVAVSQISENQRRLLNQALTEDEWDDFPRYLFRVVREIPEDETLDPQWADLWDRVKTQGPLHYPPQIIAQLEKRLENVQRIDTELQSIRLNQNAKVVFLLGAGASAPEPSGIPTVRNLLPELWRRARKLGRDDLDVLSSWCEERGISNIEDLLTAAYIANFVAKNAGTTGLLNYFLFRAQGESIERRLPPMRFSRGRSRPLSPVDASSIALLQETLQTLFGLLTSTMIKAKPNPAHDGVVKFMQARPLTTVITTNYDGCIDEAILNAQLPIMASAEGQQTNANERRGLVKMHGSINWAFCESCQDIRVFDLPFLKNMFENDSASFAVIGICTKCGGQRKPLLVPPLSFKFLFFPNLVDLWQTARQRIEESDWLIVVGFSFSDAETYLAKIIARSLTVKPSQKMIICDTNPNLAEIQRTRFSALIDGFDSKRVLRAVGTCDVILPPLLDLFLKPVLQPVQSSPVLEQEATSAHRS